MGTYMPEVFESIVAVALDDKLPRSQRRRIANSLWETTHGQLVFEAIYAKARENIQAFDAQNIANTLWAMAETGIILPELFEPLCKIAAEKVQFFNLITTTLISFDL